MVDEQPSILLVALEPASWSASEDGLLRRVRAKFAVSLPPTTSDALHQAGAIRPAVALIRARRWGRREAAYIAELRAASPRTALCLTTVREPDPFALVAAGVRGWLPTSGQPARWLRAVRALASGGSWLLPLFASWMLLNLEAEHVPLPREMEVLRRVRRGEQYGEIAAMLNTTVEDVKRDIYRALDAVIDILNGLDDSGDEASGDRAPRPRPNAPGSLHAALPLPSETPLPLHAVAPPIDDATKPNEQRQRSA